MNIYQRVVENPSEFDFDVPTLGPCLIDSPIRDTRFVRDGARVLMDTDHDIFESVTKKLGRPPTFEKAGPRAKIFHDPAWSRAAILTAGGLCPGLNHVVKGIVEILALDYGIKVIHGIRYGYRGLVKQSNLAPLILTPDSVDAIHTLGGTILGTSRGEQDTGEIIETLMRAHINLLFCVGGDGTLRAAREIAGECLKNKLGISVVGIPKTIDNDLNFVGHSFGFETAIAETGPVIDAAHTEARGTDRGVGLVKLMGRDSGFIAAYATVANPVVNFCLIPEDAFTLDGKNGLLAAIERRFASGKDHCVIVVAEGAGQELINAAQDRDLSGNLLKKDIGEFLKNRITAHFAEKGDPVSVKYFDPSYMIRSVPAKGSDAVRCFLLARNAVHAALAGRTNCVVGNHRDTHAVVPISLAAAERQKVNLDSTLWRSVLDATRQESLFGLRG
ncbi:MAG: ATP-dependent 6-phosphofructokinase [Kiritimatiellaeota bacterium]|nr:ATP-dependent 6-phosphofructokinase [Kiritimatiellota bacterium]